MAEARAIIPDHREPQYHASKSRPWGSGIPANLCRAKVAREKKPPAKAAKPEPAKAVAPPIAKPLSPVGRRIGTYFEFVDACRDRADELEISRIELDRLTGLADAHASMLLTKSPMKIFGPVSLPLMLDVLGLRLLIIEDPELTARTLRRRTRRLTSHAHYRPQFPPISGPAKGWLFGYPAPMEVEPNP
jgi:hypothetical protein